MLCWCNQMNVSLILNRSECTMAAADPQFKYVYNENGLLFQGECEGVRLAALALIMLTEDDV